eukprot:6191798-Pleurochrysis_carterae.AAC.2
MSGAADVRTSGTSSCWQGCEGCLRGSRKLRRCVCAQARARRRSPLRAPSSKVRLGGDIEVCVRRGRRETGTYLHALLRAVRVAVPVDCATACAASVRDCVCRGCACASTPCDSMACAFMRRARRGRVWRSRLHERRDTKQRGGALVGELDAADECVVRGLRVGRALPSVEERHQPAADARDGHAARRAHRAEHLERHRVHRRLLHRVRHPQLERLLLVVGQLVVELRLGAAVAQLDARVVSQHVRRAVARGKELDQRRLEGLLEPVRRADARGESVVRQHQLEPLVHGHVDGDGAVGRDVDLERQAAALQNGLPSRPMHCKHRWSVEGRGSRRTRLHAASCGFTPVCARRREEAGV